MFVDRRLTLVTLLIWMAVWSRRFWFLMNKDYLWNWNSSDTIVHRSRLNWIRSPLPWSRS